MTKKVGDDLYRVDEADPVSRFVTDRLEVDWATVLLVTFMIYGPFEKIVLPTLGGFGRFGSSYPMTTWIPDIESLLTGFVEFPFFFAYYIWSGRGLGSVFKRLSSAGIFADEMKFQEFWSRARKSFNHRAWWMISIAIAIGAMLVWQFVVWGAHADVPPWFELTYLNPTPAQPNGALAYFHGSRPFVRGFSILLIGIVAYALAQIVIREVLALVWLSRLWGKMEDSVTIHPYHHDDAGGMGGVGQHALQLSTFVLFLLLFIVMGSFLPSLRLHVQGAGTPLWDGRLVVVWILYFVFIGSTIRPLFLRPHELMCRSRDQRVSVVSDELDALLEQQQKAVRTDSAGLDAIAKQIDALKKVRMQIVDDAPVWPFTTELRVKLGLSSLPALLLPMAKLGLEHGFRAVVKVFQ